MRSAVRRALGLVLLAALGFAPTARAQVASTGNIYGTVKDESGAVLPGASVTLTGALGTRSTTSGTNGDFRFVNVDHGTHQLRVALTGFTAVTRPVTVVIGQNAELAFTPEGRLRRGDGHGHGRHARRRHQAHGHRHHHLEGRARSRSPPRVTRGR